MNKIRLLFLIIISVVSLICLILFSTFHQSPPIKKLDNISQFKITKISGNGRIYYSRTPIEGELHASPALKEVKIEHMQYNDEMYIKSDVHTSFEFYCFETSFVMLPGSYLYYQPKTKELYFFSGEFYWKKEIKNRKLDVSLKEPSNLLTLSQNGRARITSETLNIWNFDGKMSFNYQDQEFDIKNKQLFSVVTDSRFRRKRSPKIFNILPLPENIDPASKVIPLTNPSVSVVRFNWRVVRGNPKYKFMLYSSELKENILLERLLDTNHVMLDLLQFEERDFYWEVIPVESLTQREGIPSRMGHVKMIGSLTIKKNVQRPPELNVNSMTVNGNLVFIRGTAEINATLYINDDEIKVDRNGSFIHTISYSTIGPKKVVIKLVSPLGVETIEERNITIFDQ